jgi:hypothetical protein
MTFKCKDFVILIRHDNSPAGAEWSVLKRFTAASAAWACLNEQRSSGHVVRIARQ